EHLVGMAARIAPQLSEQVINDATDTTRAVAVRKREKLRVQGDAHLPPRLVVTLGVVSDPGRWPARRSPGGDAALWVAGAVLFLALAALVFGGSREPGLSMLVLCVLAAILAALGSVLLVWSIGYQRLAYTLTASSM